MGYTNQTLELLKQFKNIKWKDIEILELGSQDISTTIDDVNTFIKSFNCQPVKIKNYITKNYTRLSTKFLYDSLNVKSYTCIDIDGYHNSLNFDLNYNVLDKYNFNNQYDIVTNFGTTEHIFNQFSCFENIHNFCKAGGYIIIGLPIEGFKNHCFFNYQPTLFEHLADANNYEILYINYGDVSYCKKNDSKNITVVYKKKTNDKFKFPIQNKFNKNVEKLNNFENNFIRDRVLQLTDIDLFSIKRFAIFGTGESGEEAYAFTKKLNLNVICFIDDYKTGYYDRNIEIVDYNTFLDKYKDMIELIIIGSGQTGNIETRDDLQIDILELSCLL